MATSTNPYPFLSLTKVLDFEPLARARGVSKVARSSRGFLTQYKRYGQIGLDPWWRNRRKNFISRHMAQLIANDEPLYQADGTPTRRHLALVMWAFSPDPQGLRRAAR